MKKILSLIAVLGLTAISSQAQINSYQSLSLPATLAAGTTNYPAGSYQTIANIKQQQVGFTSTCGASSVGATNIFVFQPSVDGLNYDTNSVNSFYATNAVTAAGTNTWSGKFLVGGYYQSLRLSSIVTTGTITNYGAAYGIKISAP